MHRTSHNTWGNNQVDKHHHVYNVCMCLIDWNVVWISKENPCIGSRVGRMKYTKMGSYLLVLKTKNRGKCDDRTLSKFYIHALLNTPAKKVRAYHAARWEKCSHFQGYNDILTKAFIWLYVFFSYSLKFSFHRRSHFEPVDHVIIHYFFLYFSFCCYSKYFLLLFFIIRIVLIIATHTEISQ